MSKVLKVFALVGSVVLSVFAPPIGAALSKVLGVSLSVAKAITTVAGGALAIIGTSGRARSPVASLPDLDRLNLTSVAAAPRKLVFGTTAMAADLRYTEPSGTDQRFVDAIIHLASHRCTSVDEIRIGDKVAWTSAGGVQGIFVGFMTVEVILEAGPSNFHTVNAGTGWGSAQRMTGCCTMKMRFDRQGTKRADSPFAAGVPQQVLTIGKGMPLYDPRRDSTVPGGSGPHRINDQSTWQFSDGATDLGNNPALQALAWLIGWRVMGQVSVGLGLPPARINLQQFAAAANVCDENIALQAGGTQKRYQGAGLFADNSPPFEVMEAFASSVAGWWDDSSGRIGLFPAVNDLAGPLVQFGDDDILSGVEWDPFPEITEVYNVARGVNPDPRLPANFQPTDYPEVRIASTDGIDRFLQANFALVQDKARAQRLAKQALQRAQYRGVARLTLGIRAWQIYRGQPIALSFGGLGWSQKLFRVESWAAQLDGSVIVTLREENASIYLWDREEAPSPAPATPVVYDPKNNPFLVTVGSQIGVDDGATRNIYRGAWSSLPNGTEFIIGDEVLDQNALWTPAVNHTKTAGNGPPTLPTTSNATWTLKLQSGAGAPGLNTATAVLYGRAASAPALPTGSIDYTFATGAMTGVPAHLFTSPPGPAAGQKQWRTQAPIAGVNATETIAPASWSAFVEWVKDGDPGLSVAELTVYRRASAPPAAPSGGSFNFSTQVLTPPANWSAGIPANDGNPVYAAIGIASVVGTTGSATPTWGAPVLALQDAQAVNAIFRRAATQPATPSPSAGIPAGWSDTPPAGSDRLWVSYGSRASPVLNWTWGTPAPVEGLVGVSTRTVFRRFATLPDTPDPSPDTPGGWYATTNAVPAGSEPMWASTGERPLGGGNYVWGTPVRHEAITAVQTGGGEILPEGTPSPEIKFTLGPGESRIVRGDAIYLAPVTSGSLAVQIESGPAGGSWSSSTGAAAFFNTFEPAVADHSITVTNPDTVAQLFRVRGQIIVYSGDPGPRQVAASILTV
jgi:hypothetical protein